MLQNIKAVFGLLTFLFGTHCALAQVDYVVNEPFTATETQTVTRDGKITAESVALARASNGSIYRAFSSKGKPAERASIDDVPNHRIILLDLKKQTYVIQPNAKLTTKTADDVEDVIRSRREQSRERASLGLGFAGRENHSDLGTRTEDDIMVYGWGADRITLRPPLRGKPQSDLITHAETWSTDFGVNTSYEHVQYDEDRPDDPKTLVREQDVVTDIQRDEPDAALFRIPEGYTLEDGRPRAAARPRAARK